MKKFNSFFSFLICFFLFSNFAFSTDLYWVNGSGKWNDSNHWSTSLNGAGGAGIPTATTTVHISSSGQTLIIELDSNVTIQNLELISPESIVLKGPIGHVLTVQNSITWGNQNYQYANGFSFSNTNIPIKPKQKFHNNKLITSVTVNQNNVSCFGAQDGKAWVANITGSTGPFAYQWRRFSDNVIVSTTDTARNLSGGLYSLRVTDLSDNTFNQQFVNIVEPSEIGTLIFPTDETCVNSCDGSINIAITGGTPPYNILWSNSASTPTIVGLCDGQYSVIITDANGCVRHDTAIVGEPSLIQPSVSVNNVDCFGNCNGSAVANPTGGTGVYVNYQWSTGQNGLSNQLNGLCDGTYSVTVTDSDGCSNSETFTVTEPSAPLTASLSSTDALCFGSSSGTINVNPSGGTSPYTYAWSDGSNTSQNRTNLSIGTYTVTVTDANNCTYVDSRTINQPSDMSIAFTGISHVDCNGNLTGAATAVPTGGTSPYTSFSWSSGSNTSTASGLSAGWHRVTVTDQNACAEVDSVLITEPTPLVATIDLQQDPLCNGSTNGIINTTPSGGTAPYSYVWSDGPITTEDRNNLAAGTYSFTLTDDNNCTVVQSITLTDPPVLTVIIDSLENVKCKGNSTGYARALAAGGTAPYSYQWSNSVVGRANPTIPAGSYTVTVTDAHNCTATTNVNITEPANALSVSIAKTDASCLGTNDGSATANPVGGTAPYSYNWGGGLTTKTINGLSAGTYTVTVTDNNGCTEIQSVTIDQPTALTVSINPTHLLCNNDNSGEAEAMPSGGTPPYSYLWSDNQNTKTAIGLAAGNYTVTVTDDNGCTGTANVTLTEPTSLTASINSSNNVSCNGLSDGSATVSASGGTASYSFQWNDASAQTTATANNLSAGNYSVTVTDANGCTDVANVTITQPNAISPNSTISDVSCFGNADGSITINSVSGGTSPYSFSWSHGPTTQSVSNLGPGTYTLTITDNNGCTDINSFTITSPSSALSISVSGTNNNCAGESIGSASASVSGGTPPYSYNWSNSQTTSSINNLSAGTYTVTVTDSRSCQVTGSYTVTEPSAISISVLNIDHPNCNAGNDGSISVSASGGIGPLTYQWNDPASQTTATATGLTAGNYQLVVTDANGCMKDSSFILTEPNALDVTFTSTNVNCGSPSPDGSATANVTGGVSPYSYLWSNSSTSASINNLAAGKYYITVTDANNCDIVDSVDIVQSASNFNYIDSLVNNRCFGDSLGRLDFIGVSGGTAPYSYTWSSNIQNFSGPSAFWLPAGNYSVTISDALGCDSIVNFSITEPPQLTIGLAVTDASCNGSADGSINSTVSGGVPPYSYAWSNSQTTANLNNITAGTYSVTVTDANFCTIADTVVVNEPTNAIVISLDSLSNPSCNGSTDGSISISASGGVGVLSYLWNDASFQTSPTAIALPAGTYMIVVTDANGCSNDTSFTLSEPNALNLTFAASGTGCAPTPMGSATANVSGGTPPYTYQWSNSANTATINNLAAGTYRLTVSDDNNCTLVDSVDILPSTPFSYMDSLWNVRCFGDSTGSFLVFGLAGGTAPYSFTWSSNVVSFNNFSTAAEANSLPAGNYSLTISDAAGCDSIVDFTISEPPQLIINLTGTDASCPNYSDGSVTSAVSGGVPPYSYIWSNSQSTSDLNNVPAGTYHVTVTDANFCTVADTITIGEPANEIFITLNSLNNPSCVSSTDGSINVSATGGVGNLTYQWNDPNNQTTPTASGLGSGTYTVTVTDANGCSKDSSFTLTVPNALAITFTSSNAGCGPTPTGSATANVTGGTAPYTYLWSNSATTPSINNLTVGTYYLTVTDANNCSLVDSVNITPSSPFNYIDSLFNARCFGDSSGTYFVFALSGGTAPYNFSWSGNVTNFNNFSNSAEANNLPAGNYSLTISDAAGCDSIVNFTITEPSPISASFSTSMSHCTVDDGSATISASGGIPPYVFDWLGTSVTGATITGLDAGIHTVEVRDANFCRDTFSVSIGDSLAPSVSLNTFNPSCSGANNGMAIASSPCLTTGTCSIEWLHLDGTSTNVFNDTLIAPAGTYISKVDLNGCIAFDTIAISNMQSFAVLANINHQTCGSSCNGNIKISPTGGNAPYTFTWSPTNIQGQGTDSVSALCKGVYSLTVTDANGCIVDTSFTVDSTSIQILFNKKDISCHGASDGTISTNIVGGTPPYTYSWTGGLSGANPTNVSAGIYILDIMDNIGCSVSDTVEIFEPAALISSLTINNSQNCGPNTCDGTIDVTTSGGTAPYSYQLFDASFNLLQTTTSPIIGLLCSGDYWVVTTDANGCADTAKAMIEAINGPVTGYTTTNEDCFGSCDGEINVSNPCTDCGEHVLYDINGNELQRINNIFNFGNLCSGDYVVRTIDTLTGCSSLDTLFIGFDNSLSVSLSATEALCNGSNNGSITSIITGGTAPFIYSWTGGLSGANPTNVSAGTYSVTITDANGCSGTASIMLSEPDPITYTTSSTDASCVVANGSATINPSGGTGNIDIEWLDKNLNPIGQNTNTASNIVAGIYFAALMDDNGCTDTVAVMVNTSNGPSATISSVNENCTNSCDGSVSVKSSCIDNGVCTLEWRNSSGQLVGTADSIPNLCPGDYFVTIIDTGGCVTNLQTSISSATPITASLGSTSTTCGFTDCVGSAFVSASGGSGSLSYEWFYFNSTNPIGSNDTIDSLCNAGIYFVEVSDQEGCMERFSVVVNDTLYDPINSISTTNTCAGSCDGTASVVTGCSACTVKWFDASGSAIDSMKSNISGLCAGNYYVQVSSPMGCVAIESFTINEYNPVIINATITNSSCSSVADGSISLNTSGGSGNYTYIWSPGPGSGQGTNTASGLVAGTYFVTVNDGACSVLDTFNVLAPPAISVGFSNTDANCGSADGSATANISGGTSPYDLQWFDNLNVLLAGETNATLNNVAAGTYRLRVRDNNVCEQFFSTTINNMPNQGPEIILDSLFNANCFGSNNGKIHISANDPNQPLTYTWLPMGLGSQDVQNLTAGTYTVIVENSLGCISSESFTINESPEMVATFSKNDADCGLCSGDASINVSGGTAPYTYLWSNGSTGNSLSNLCAGVYSVEVSDANSCTETFNFTINNSGGITGENISVTSTCTNSCDATATVDPIGGTPPYSYLWMHNGNTTNTLNNLCAGTYYLQMTDFNSCTRIVEVDVTGTSANLTINEVVNPSSCDGATCDGNIFLNVSGGLPPYSYSWAPGTFADTNYIDGLCSGIYSVTVTDANLCSITKNINVNSEAPINFDPQITVSDVTCFGACDGGLFSEHSITGQYITQWVNDQGTAIAPPNSDVPNGVCAGSYTLIVSTISNNCQEYYTVQVSEPDSLIVGPTVTKDLSCFGDCNGEIHISALGGKLAYSYSWDDVNSQTSNPAVGLCAGTYNVTVTDGNGCTAVNTAILNEPAELSLSVQSFTGVDCSSNCDGSVDITIHGGIGPYSFSWNGGQTIEDPTDLCYGENIVTVTDAKGCTLIDTVDIPAVDTVDVTANADLSICENDPVTLNGSVIGSNITSIGWYEMPAGNHFSNSLDTSFFLSAGTYRYALIASSPSCTDTAFVNVIVDPSPSIDANGPITLYKDESKQVTLTGKNSTYIYDWTPGTYLSDSTIAEPIVSAREKTTYIIIATNSEGCTDMDSLLVKYYPELVITTGITPNGDEVNDKWNIDFVDRYPDIEVTIFNRWGQEVFHSEGYSKPWDGTMNGKDLPVGTYYYIIDLKDEKYDPITGPITIMR